MKLSDIGEFGLIERIARDLGRELPEGVTGIGDDCAVIPLHGRKRLLVTTDMLVEGTHFMIGAISPRDLGHKSLAVNLSDIAAMGGHPEWAFVSLAVPPDTPLAFLDGFYSGLAGMAREYGVRVLGGDTTRSLHGLVINITLIGTAEAGRIRYRSGARPGDIVALTGNVGDSAAGLRILLSGLPGDREAARLIRRHNRPEPHIAQGAWLAGRKEVRTMMDVSDGVDSDIRRIMDRSKCGADIHLERLPVSPELIRKAGRMGLDPLELAAAGGEDYCLLVTIDPDGFTRLAKAYEKTTGRPIHPIGSITRSASGLRYFREGRSVSRPSGGFSHFE